MTAALERAARKLAAYAAYHRDPRNRATHWIGVPMIAFAVFLFLAETLTWLAPALVVLALVLYYAGLDPRLAAAVAPVLSLMVVASIAIVRAEPAWPVTALASGLFVVGWVAQFIGHVFEGRRPALFDDLALAFVAPLFLAAEAAFACGRRQALARDVETRVRALLHRD